jgi:hypothetical protein
MDLPDEVVTQMITVKGQRLRVTISQIYFS